MLIKTLPVGQLETNCYIVTDENTLSCIIIDPGDESGFILDYIEKNKLLCKAIFLTHGHYDHTGAVSAIAGETGAKVYMHEADDARNIAGHAFNFTLPENGEYYVEDMVYTFDSLEFRVMFTPGHSPGGVTLICDDAIFTGDTLFKGSCGRTDLEGGSIEELLNSLKKICMIEGSYEVYPGHMDSSTLIREKMFNYYCRVAMR